MEAYKKTWRFVKNQKFLALTMIGSLILFQILSTLSPLVIQELVDHQVLAIVDNWYQTDNSEGTANYNGKYYQTAPIANTTPITILLLDDGFYISNDEIDLNQNLDFNQEKQEVTVQGVNHSVTKLTADEIKAFYQVALPMIIKVIILLAVIQLTSVLFSYLQRLCGAFMFSNIAKTVRLEASAKLSYINIQKVEAEPAGKMANRFLNDSIGVPQLYSSTINILISSGLAIIFSFIGMYILEPKLAIACIIIIPIMYFWITLFSRKINIIAQKVNETNSQIIARINEIINGIEILKAFNSKKDVINDFTKLNNQFLDEQMEEVKLHVSGGWNAIQLFQGVISALVVIFLAYLNVKNIVKIEAGVIYAYYVYIGRIIAPIGLLFHELGMIEHSKVKIKRIFRILDAELEPKTIKPINQYQGKVEFANVTFSYGESTKPALQNINFIVNPGEKVAIVGRSGSGKSTIINLLLRFNELRTQDKGTILIDDQSIYCHNKRTYRQHLGIILQEPIIFSGTIASNIRFGSEATSEQIISILKEIGADNLLDKIAYNLDYQLDNRGENLSLGEKQLICFARVLVRNPQILIMDEATANIDIETESLINNAIKIAAQKRTMIIVAHRLSTVRDADCIIHLEQGKIIESGSRKELLKQQGKYAEMELNQMQI